LGVKHAIVVGVFIRVQNAVVIQILGSVDDPIVVQVDVLPLGADGAALEGAQGALSAQVKPIVDRHLPPPEGPDVPSRRIQGNVLLPEGRKIGGGEGKRSDEVIISPQRTPGQLRGNAEPVSSRRTEEVVPRVIGKGRNDAAGQSFRGGDASLTVGRELIDVGEIESAESPQKAPHLETATVALLHGISEVARAAKEACTQGPGAAQEPGFDEGETVARLAATQLKIGLQDLAAAQEIPGSIGSGQEGAAQSADSTAHLDLVAVRLFPRDHYVHLVVAGPRVDIGFLGYLPIAELVDLSQSKSEAFEIEQILLPHGDLSAEHPVPRCGVSGKLQSVYPILPLLVDLDLEVRHLIGLAIDHLVGCDVEIPLFAVIQLDPPQPLFHRTVVENLSRLDGNPGKDFLLRKDLVPFHREGPDLVLGSLL